MKTYRKRPLTIQAEKFTPGDDFKPGETRNGVHHSGCSDNGTPFFVVKTLEGHMQIKPGDWLIKGIRGEFYPCKPEIFEVTYEAVDE